MYILIHSLIYVSTDGNDEGSIGEENAPFATIQEAIDYSWDGDTVLVSAGTYYENIQNSKNNLIVKSIDGRETTILRNNSCEPYYGIYYTNGNNEIDGFTIDGIDCPLNNVSKGITIGNFGTDGVDVIIKNWFR